MPTPVPDELVERLREAAATAITNPGLFVSRVKNARPLDDYGRTDEWLFSWQSRAVVAALAPLLSEYGAEQREQGRREGIEAAATALDDEGRVKAVRVVRSLFPSAPSEEATP